MPTFSETAGADLLPTHRFTAFSRYIVTCFYNNHNAKPSIDLHTRVSFFVNTSISLLRTLPLARL